jgi:hypothetical protein
MYMTCRESVRYVTHILWSNKLQKIIVSLPFRFVTFTGIYIFSSRTLILYIFTYFISYIYFITLAMIIFCNSEKWPSKDLNSGHVT